MSPSITSSKLTPSKSTPPPPSSLSPSVTYTKDRDTLAFEHDRQKYKKTLDRAKNKARKAWASAASRTAQGQGHQVHRHGAQEKGVVVGDEDTDGDMLDREVKLSKVTEAVSDVEMTKRGSKIEVKLTDLVVLSRKGRKGVDEYADFEIIPHIRSVIVLDDYTYNGAWKGMDVDMEALDSEEPWECVGDEFDAGAEGKLRKREATYARVAALSK